MTDTILLDSGVLGQASHPRKNPELAQWLDRLLTAEISVVIAEIVDYEVRRELIRANKKAGLERLDELKEVFFYLPISTSAMLRAAELWARARQRGRPTADPKALDCDVILAAQALELNAIVVTENIRHLSLFVEARSWKQFSSRHDLVRDADRRGV